MVANKKCPYCDGVMVICSHPDEHCGNKICTNTEYICQYCEAEIFITEVKK